MAFSHNYYAVLGLPFPSSSSSSYSASEEPLTQDTLRRAYKKALLKAHPDKAPAPTSTPTSTTTSTPTPPTYTIDTVREALAVLSDEKRRREFERWWAVHSTSTTAGVGQGQGQGQGQEDGQEDFILGLELLDLSDFEAGIPPFVRMGTPEGEDEEQEGGEGELDVGIDFDDLRPVSPSDFRGGDEAGEKEGDAATNTTAYEATADTLPVNRKSDPIPIPDEDKDKEETDKEEADDIPPSPPSPPEQEQNEMQWTRPCRCGAEKGFRILESELESAEARGEREVLVGCEGCSLWVRVGFDVEEG